MGLDNNDDIAKMFNSNSNNKQTANSFSKQSSIPEFKFSDLLKEKEVTKEVDFSKLKKVEESKTIDKQEIKINAQSVGGMDDKLKNIPPFVIIGIGLIIGANFTPYKWLFMCGFICVIIGMFDKILTKEKKEIIVTKIKGWFKKKDGNK